MKDLLTFVILTVFGFALGSLLQINPIEIDGFGFVASVALALGLYTAVTGIDLKSLGQYKKISIFIITAGVPIQILATGALMYLIYPHPISLLIAVAIDQIDPISVSTLLNNKMGMSTAAKSLLNVWASFDDPVTVLFGFTFLLPLITGVSVASFGVLSLGIVSNIVPAIILFVFSKRKLLDNRKVQIFILCVAMIFTVFAQAFLFIALIALFIRPFESKMLSKGTTVIYFLILVLVGMAIPAYGIDLRLGFLLAIIEFFVVQPLSAMFMVKGTVNDIFRLAFAQQNGLTTILMGLTFQVLGFNVLPILLPAIVFINFFNLTINGLYNYKEKSGLLITKADPKLLSKYRENLLFK